MASDNGSDRRTEKENEHEENEKRRKKN